MTTLIRGASSQESEKIKRQLEKANIQFREVFSSSECVPVLITSSSGCSYKGVGSIMKYCILKSASRTDNINMN